MTPAEKLYCLADREIEKANGQHDREMHKVSSAIYHAAALVVEALTDKPAKGADEELRREKGET